ncbi:translation machinery-associated protein 16 [Peziza echinospora]|nr:translation machinery-associated protein 16 [Peziza echinospora]
MPKALSKVAKSVKAKRDGKGLAHVHPGSRDHKRLGKATIREERMQKLHSAQNKTKQAELARLYFFQDALKESQLTNLTEDDVRKMIHDYIHRDDEERAKVIAERRPGRPPSTKEDQYRFRFEREEEEFRSGFRIPDFLDPENLLKFVSWDGSLGALPLVKFTRVTSN